MPALMARKDGMERPLLTGLSHPGGGRHRVLLPPPHPLVRLGYG